MRHPEVRNSKKLAGESGFEPGLHGGLDAAAIHGVI
ncbi:hypothetical protein ES708_10640 [subsurface metagenome]|jgi:hypothetical protein